MTRNLSDYRVVVLCEDKFHYYFIRGFLMTQGVNDRKITSPYSLPEGRQSGEQFVRENFVDGFIKYARSQENVLFISMQDIDRVARTPVEARGDFERLVHDKGLGNIGLGDKLLLLFPKRNIETWFEWLQKEHPRSVVDENQDFKQSHRHDKPAIIGKKAGELYSRSKGDGSICTNAPDSILHACGEFNRFVMSDTYNNKSI